MDHYTFPCAVEYPDLGEDALFSHRGMMRIMQEAACYDSSRAGYGPFDIEKNGIAWIICGWKMRLDRRPPWGTRLSVQTWPRTMSAMTSERDFLVTDGDGQLVGAATSRWLLLNAVTGHTATVTPEVAAAYPLDPDSRAMPQDVPINGRSGPDAAETFTYTAMGRDLDMFHHVNNIHYLDLAREALPPETAHTFFPNVEILYKRQVRRGDTVHFFHSCSGGKHLVELKDAGYKKTHALVWFF